MNSTKNSDIRSVQKLQVKDSCHRYITWAAQNSSACHHHVGELFLDFENIKKHSKCRKQRINRWGWLQRLRNHFSLVFFFSAICFCFLAHCENNRWLKGISVDWYFACTNGNAVVKFYFNKLRRGSKLHHGAVSKQKANARNAGKEQYTCAIDSVYDTNLMHVVKSCCRMYFLLCLVPLFCRYVPLVNWEI